MNNAELRVDGKTVGVASNVTIETKKCLCTFAQRMTGDGCYICNPELAKELSCDEHETLPRKDDY